MSPLAAAVKVAETFRERAQIASVNSLDQSQARLLRAVELSWHEYVNLLKSPECSFDEGCLCGCQGLATEE